jgi:Xaa-Pro dipeptidase
MNTDYSKWELDGPDMSIFSESRTNFLATLKANFHPNLEGLLVLKGGKDTPRYDTDTIYYHFFQESNFFYLTGIRDPDFWAVFNVATGALDVFFEKQPDDYKIWMTVMSPDDVAKKYGYDVNNVHYNSDLDKFIWDANPKNIYTLEGINEYSGLPIYNPNLKFDGDYVDLNGRIRHEPKIYEALCETRMMKTAKEIDLLKFIADITNDAHKEILKNIRPGLYERDLENIFNNYLSGKYYTRIWAYPCIGCAGVNCSTLHYDKNDVIIKDGDMYLADMGVRFCNYCSDVTQTIPANGKFTQEQRDIYSLVLKSNRSAMNMIKPGDMVTYFNMDEKSKRVILEGLQDLGLIRKEPTIDVLYDAGVYKIFMPHFLGHLVGLDVHDVGSKVEKKKLRYIEEGNFITVEPGIYFIDFVLENAFRDPKLNQYLNEQVIRRYAPVGGVRIEDDVIVTKDGYVNFQKDLPRTVEEIEDFMAKHNPYLK